jgi:elongation factor Ts
MITAAQVNELRKMTGSGMMDCKKALTEANGNMEEAVIVLRKKGAAKAASKSERSTSEGSVFIELSENKGSMVLIGCETDFVANNDAFQKLGNTLAKEVLTSGLNKENAEAEITKVAGVIGENMKLLELDSIESEVIGSYIHSNKKIGVMVALKGGTKAIAEDIAMHAAAMNPQVLSPSDVSSKLVDQEKEIWVDQLKAEGKPEKIMENIMKGKEKKFRSESALIAQSFVKDPSKTVEQYAKESGAEVIQFLRFAI